MGTGNNSQAPNRASHGAHHGHFLDWVVGPQVVPVQVFVPFEMLGIVQSRSHVKPTASKGSRQRLGEWAS